MRNDFEEAKPRRSEKKDTNARKRDQTEIQESPKSENVKACHPLLGRSGGPKVFPRDPQEHLRGAQESSKTLSR